MTEDRPTGHEVSETTLIDDGTQDPELEAEADDFVRRMLIPAQFEKELDLIRDEASLKAFARRVGIAPDIVLGRLQFEGKLHYSHLPHLKSRAEFGP